MTNQIDRLAMRARPHGSPIMAQIWDRLLFMHWPIEAELLRPLIPPALTIDTFNGKAWIGVTPFTLNGLRPMIGPGIPGLKSFHELNVRTYVHLNGVPGVWFFSLYASKTIPVLAARLTYALPYIKATIRVTIRDGTTHYKLSRRSSPETQFVCSWSRGEPLRSPDVDSLAFFLVERYCLYAASGGGLYRARIYHVPWALEDVAECSACSSLIAQEGLPEPIIPPLLYYSHTLNVEVWPPERVD